jgi:hypothetical protein
MAPSEGVLKRVFGGPQEPALVCHAASSAAYLTAEFIFWLPKNRSNSLQYHIVEKLRINLIDLKIKIHVKDIERQLFLFFIQRSVSVSVTGDGDAKERTEKSCFARHPMTAASLAADASIEKSSGRHEIAASSAVSQWLATGDAGR